MTTVNIKKFEEIVAREEANRNELPEHTMDWYTYNNRITLLNEVKELFKVEKEKAQKVVAKSPVTVPVVEVKKVHPSKESREEKND